LQLFGREERKSFVSLIPVVFLLAAGNSLIKNVRTQESPKSPRLTALATRIAQGDSDAIERFWEEVAEQGTPLVEPIEGDWSHVLVTFLYRSGEDTKNVVTFVDRGLWKDIDSNRMERFRTTDIWFRTYRFRKDARFTYSLSVNDPLTPIRAIKDADEWVKRSARWFADPLNPKRFPAYPKPVSIVELPGAPTQKWIIQKPGISRGMVSVHNFKSVILNNERTVWVYTPPAYENEEFRCGILLLFDGGAYNNWIPTPTILDNLISERLIPPIIAVFVSHPNLPGRNCELTCSAQFTRLIVKELIPWIRHKYKATTDPGLYVIGGSSNGGLGAACIAFHHPEIFGNVLSQSGAFMYSPTDEEEPGWLIRQFKASPTLPIRFHLDCGLMEDQSAQNDSPSTLIVNRHLRDVLLVKGYKVHYQEFNGGHEYLNWRGTLADGLIALLGDKKVK
jgi:enterochelin esterase-like enzyme